eukprot:TRINITY_DN16004_c0_g1_i3.p1 TRINITY_DN16004_c0_g1~~TRINITY_DN16004_c0_g1_i3.p1  ORF type:complete len:659 (+),score=123.80 TRINITY_DN16004_c0_g1_i3:64-2040(+)
MHLSKESHVLPCLPSQNKPTLRRPFSRRRLSSSSAPSPQEVDDSDRDLYFPAPCSRSISDHSSDAATASSVECKRRPSTSGKLLAPCVQPPQAFHEGDCGLGFPPPCSRSTSNSSSGAASVSDMERRKSEPNPSSGAASVSDMERRKSEPNPRSHSTMPAGLQSLPISSPVTSQPSSRKPSKNSMLLAAGEDASPAALKATKIKLLCDQWFRGFDESGDGIVDRMEFKDAVAKSSVGFSDILFSRLIDEIDVNKDGQIEEEEFIAWVSDANANYTVGVDGWVQKFDLAEVMQPLFQLFGPDMDDKVSFTKFVDRYRILANSVTLSAKAGKKKLQVWLANAEAEFRKVDLNHDGMISFSEFMQWQRELLRGSGIPNSLLSSTVTDLVEALNTIDDMMKLDKCPRTSFTPEVPKCVLQDTMAKIASVSCQLYLPVKDRLVHLESSQSKLRPGDHISEAKWLEPPIGSIACLLRQCAEDNLFISSQKLDLMQVPEKDTRRQLLRIPRNNRRFRRAETPVPAQLMLCCPMLEGYADGVTCWFAWVKRDFNTENEADLYYRFEQSAPTKWQAADIQKADLKQIAVQGGGIIALLKTQELIFTSLSWGKVTLALKASAEIGLVSVEKVQHYLGFVEGTVQSETLVQALFGPSEVVAALSTYAVL